MNRILFILTLGCILSYSLSADNVTVKATKAVLENVKTTQVSKTEILVESKDGTKQSFKPNQIVVSAQPVVWEDPKPEEKPGFFKRLFSSNKKEETSDANVTETAKTTSPDGKTETAKEEPKSFFDRRFPEITMGVMAVLWIILP